MEWNIKLKDRMMIVLVRMRVWVRGIILVLNKLEKCSLPYIYQPGDWVVRLHKKINNNRHI